MVLITTTDYSKFKSHIATLGGPVGQRRVFYSVTPPGPFRALAAIPGAGGGGAGEESVNVLFTTVDTTPPTFAVDFPTALLVDSFALI